jgi:hypothetical protein
MIRIVLKFIVLSLVLIDIYAFYLANTRVTSHKLIHHVLHAKKHKVTIQHDGKDTVIEVREDCSILEAALDNGENIHFTVVQNFNSNSGS